MPQPGGQPGYPGGDQSGSGGGTNGPADFKSPVGAVNAFLQALAAKDLDRLAEATALRAPTEAKGTSNQNLFRAILDKSLPKDELDELAKKLEGFTVSGTNAWTSTARLGVTLMKGAPNGARFVRTITARHEKAGWKVVDISGAGKYEKPVVMPRMGRGGPRRR